MAEVDSTMRIADLSLEDRPREKALRFGMQSLSTAELIAILLGSGSRGESVVHLSQRILAGSDQKLAKLAKRSIKNLMKTYKGVGEAKAIALLAALELGRRYREEMPVVVPSITSPDAAFELMRGELENLDHEEFWAVYVNNAKKVLSKKKISTGGTTSTGVDVKMIIRNALDELATGIILYHNHPSGNIRPSTSDLSLTKRVVEAAKLFDISVVDHIIIGSGSYCSLNCEGLL